MVSRKLPTPSKKVAKQVALQSGGDGRMTKMPRASLSVLWNMVELKAMQLGLKSPTRPSSSHLSGQPPIPVRDLSVRGRAWHVTVFSRNRKRCRQTGSRQSTPLSTIRTRYGNSASTPGATRTGKNKQNSLQKGSRYGISVSTPHRRYGHRLRTPFLRTPFPRLLCSGTEKQPKYKVFRRDISGTSGIQVSGYPGQKTLCKCPFSVVLDRSGQDVLGFGLGRPGFGKTLCARKLWADFSFPKCSCYTPYSASVFGRAALPAKTHGMGWHLVSTGPFGEGVAVTLLLNSDNPKTGRNRCVAASWSSRFGLWWPAWATASEIPEIITYVYK